MGLLLVFEILFILARSPGAIYFCARSSVFIVELESEKSCFSPLAILMD